MPDTGFPRADAENDFLRARRHQFLGALTRRLRGRPVDSGRLVPLDEIVGSLGWPIGAVRRSRRSRSTAWVIGISSTTATIGYLSPLRPVSS